MPVAELIGELKVYPEDMDVEVLEDWGSGIRLIKIGNVINLREFQEDGDDKVLIVEEDQG